MKHRFIPALLFLAALCWLPQSLLAHTIYIQSSRYHVGEDKAYPLFFCYGHYIPVADGIRSKKLNNIRIITPKGEVREIEIREGKNLHSYLVDYDLKGTWMLSAETNPGYYTVYIDKKGRTHHVMQPMSKIKDKAQKVETSLYSNQYTKTYVPCGKVEKGVFHRAGHALELVPVSDIFALKAGDTMELDIYQNGKLYEGEGNWDATYMGFSTQSEDMYYPRTRIKGSRLSVHLSEPGRWFVRYFIKAEAPESEQDNYMQVKQTATLTFQIDNPRKRPKSKH